MKKLIKKLNAETITFWLIAAGFITLILLGFLSCEKMGVQNNVQPEMADDSQLIPTREQYLKDKTVSVKPIGNPGKGKGKPPTDEPPTEPPVQTGQAVIYLNFSGKWITTENGNGDWVYQHETQQDFYCEPSTLDEPGKQVVVDDVVRSFADYNVFITTDSTVYQNANGWKQEVVITQTKWKTGGSGYSFIGSGSFYYHPVNFVFETALFSVDTYIGKIATHELGHAAGLRHQSTYNADCTLYSRYAEGAKMGVHWSTIGDWIYGTSYACNVYQDDKRMLTQIFGLK